MKEQFWSKLIVFVSFAVILLIAVLTKVAPPSVDTNFDWYILPKLNASLNACVFCFLLASWYFIKNGKMKAHKTCNILALLCSAAFLVSYVIYHTMTESTSFGGEGAIKYIYLFILLTHIVLSAVILPFILFTFLRAFSGKFAKHKKLARWVMPLWLYVSASGVIVYLMISPYY